MLILRDEMTGTHLAVQLGAYVSFSGALDRELQRLVAKWQHLAAPRSQLATRPRFRGYRR
jgi:hypothetical protein